MRVLIVGASGFIGGALRSAFGTDAIGTYCTHSAAGLRHLDIRDARGVRRLLSDLRPELVIHPAAQPHVDRCEDHIEESYAVNVTGTRNIALGARDIGARYIFFSTDYVFDGRAGPYGEEATPAPLNVYGHHKLEAERSVAEILDDYLVVRACGVYGFEPQAKNFVMSLLARAKRGERIHVPSDQWGTPTFVDNLASAVRELALSRHRGIYHVVGPEYLDRVSFARLACTAFGIDAALLQSRPTAELGQRAPRPLRGGLDNTKAQSVITTRLLAPNRGLELVRERLHREGLLPR